MKTQKQQILEYMQIMGEITPLEVPEEAVTAICERWKGNQKGETR